MKILMGYFILGAQTSEGVLLVFENLAHVLSQECCKNKFCAFLPEDDFSFKCIPIRKKIHQLLKELRSYILPFIRVWSFIILIRVSLNLYFQPTILGNYFFVLLCFMSFLSFEHDVMLIEL